MRRYTLEIVKGLATANNNHISAMSKSGQIYRGLNSKPCSSVSKTGIDSTRLVLHLHVDSYGLSNSINNLLKIKGKKTSLILILADSIKILQKVSKYTQKNKKHYTFRTLVYKLSVCCANQN